MKKLFSVILTFVLVLNANLVALAADYNGNAVTNSNAEAVVAEDNATVEQEKADVSVAEKLKEIVTTDVKPTKASATSGSCGEKAKWQLKGTKLVISGSGAMTDWQVGGVQ